jgi:hypothetical protein
MRSINRIAAAPVFCGSPGERQVEALDHDQPADFVAPHRGENRRGALLQHRQIARLGPPTALTTASAPSIARPAAAVSLTSPAIAVTCGSLWPSAPGERASAHTS